MRQLTISKGNQTFQVSAVESDSILNILQKNGFSLPASCGGRGVCGHCTVIADGQEVRACHTTVGSISHIQLPDTLLFSDIEMPTAESVSVVSSHCGIAVDLGTTTIALALVDLNNGTILSSKGYPNPGISYGADVLSRIEASNLGKGNLLQQDLLALISKGIHTLLQSSGIPADKLDSICISANTAMCYLLRNLSCKTLGQAPFTPTALSFDDMTAKDFFATDVFPNTTVSLLPCLDAFIGGDILSGLYFLDLPKKDSLSLFIDLGTNGEMVLGKKGHLLASSVAAGPAFEGSRIPGSIVIDALYEMQQKGAIDHTGLLQGIFFHTGYTYQDYSFTQEDIRDIQLAKASVRAGIETLFTQYGVSADNIKQVYLSGGFGTNTDVFKAISIGLLPSNCSGKVSCVGNTSLLGAIKYLRYPNPAYFDRLKEYTSVISLAESASYKEAYLKYIDFVS